MTLAEATGLSLGYSRRVNGGLTSAHPLWWEAMRVLSDQRLVSAET